MAGKQFKFWFLALGIFIAPLALFSTKLTPWTSEYRGVMLIQELAYPFAWAWHTSIHTLDQTWSRYIHLQNTELENEKLKQDLTALRIKLLDHDEQTVELNRLRNLSKFAGKLEDKFVMASVIVGQSSNAFKAVRISKGSTDGVLIGMPVITAEGVVGRVIRTGLNMSDVQLIVDYDSNIDILIQRNRIRGVLGGFANEECRLHLQRGTEIKIGDTLITSGLIGSFSKGLPVGKVTKISFETDNVSQVITVEPWVDHRRLEEVIVLLRPDPELERIVQTAGPDWIERSMQGAGG